ncbi:MAG: glycosyltransferase family 2 protein [Pseudomonadota bacterium]
MTTQFIERRLAGRCINTVTILDVVEQFDADGRLVTIYCGSGTQSPDIKPSGAAVLVHQFTIVGMPVLTFRVPDAAPMTLIINGDEVALTPAEREQESFDGLNSLLAERNGEGAETVLEWMRFHIDQQDLQAAVILDRARPGADPAFATKLKQCIVANELDVTVAILTSDLPLGKPDLPPEAHPFCVPEAPGKDRMEIPAASPWDAPIGALGWYEIARNRFLGMARAVANIDVHDLVPRDGASIFDRAQDARDGLITLSGRHCYPWRTPSGSRASFADHICVQFDATIGRKRWCIAPQKAPTNAVWRLVRVGNASPDRDKESTFFRHMALRHPTESVSKLVPKTSLVEHPQLVSLAKDYFGHKPVRVPKVAPVPLTKGRGRRAIVTTMKNEGPFILEWLAYHRAIGFDDILVYTNDCSDGTDTMLQLLMDKGYVTHRNNPYRGTKLRPQHAALQAAEEEPLICDAKWVTCIDVDEYVNIKTGDGTLDALFAAVPDANMIAMTWRLFGNSDIHGFADLPVTQQFTHCAPELARKPHQAWGFKTLFQNKGIFKKLGVHRPKGLNPQLWDSINWVNGSGRPLPHSLYRNGWRSTTRTYGYDLVQLNHYAVRSAESFLVKRDRGRVNHVDRDQGLAYWFRMNNNAEIELSVQSRLPMMHAELAKIMADPDIAAAHAHAVAAHHAKITELRSREDYAQFFKSLTGDRLQLLSRMHRHFGANVFLAGPDVIPDEILSRDPEGDWDFTVARSDETAH